MEAPFPIPLVNMLYIFAHGRPSLGVPRVNTISETLDPCLKSNLEFHAIPSVGAYILVRI